jgi:hypothetical protein
VIPSFHFQNRSCSGPEHLCRYITRPAIANDWLKGNRAGQIVLQLKSSYKGGTTHIVMSLLEFMQRLAALVPRPRLHLIRFDRLLCGCQVANTRMLLILL